MDNTALGLTPLLPTVCANDAGLFKSTLTTLRHGTGTGTLEGGEGGGWYGFWYFLR